MIARPRHIVLAAVVLVAVTRDATAQAQPQSPLAFAASSFATTEVHLNSRRIGGEWYAEDAGLTGPSRIAIAYGQPHARGRKIEGGLVPLDTVWRFGANAATTLHTDVDLTIGTLAVPRGDYALYLLYSKSGWQLIVNSASASWGSEYDAKRDFGRTALTSRTRNESRGGAVGVPRSGVRTADYRARRPSRHTAHRVGHDRALGALERRAVSAYATRRPRRVERPEGRARRRIAYPCAAPSRP
jgi:hypothetical protein